MPEGFGFQGGNVCSITLRFLEGISQADVDNAIDGGKVRVYRTIPFEDWMGVMRYEMVDLTGSITAAVKPDRSITFETEYLGTFQLFIESP
ncbi:MAG: hypothetical protein ACYS8W_04435 [Planctomycetota bacterium]|jgi:hypothetical protein